MRVAIVHDWLTGMRGGERVLEALLRIFPDADLYTLLHVPGTVTPLISSRAVHESFIAGLPGARRHYRSYLPLFPTAIERFDLRGYDLVVSSSHCVAKGVRTGDAPHVCYCHTPMRYVWDLYDDYFGPGRAHPLVRAVMPLMARRLREWDRTTASRVTRFVANSQFVQQRIARTYARASDVIYPPVDTEGFAPSSKRDDAYVIAVALVPYKRVDIAIHAFNELGRPLIVVGDGPEYGRLRKIAAHNVTFTGRVDDAELAAILGRARGLIMPMVEDFGIIAVEALAAGTPVIAYRAGGALEIVRGWSPGNENAATGIFFDTQSPESLRDAVRLRERVEFDVDVLRASSRAFSADRFDVSMRDLIAGVSGDTSILPSRREPVATCV